MAAHVAASHVAAALPPRAARSAARVKRGGGARQVARRRRAAASGARAAESGAGGAPSAASVAGAYTTTFKAAVGSGILTLPAAVRTFGLAGGSVGLVLFALLSWYTTAILLECAASLRAERGGSSEAGVAVQYDDLGRAALGGAGVSASVFAVVSCQVGSCVAFFVFIASSLADVLGVSQAAALMGVAPIAALLCQLRSAARLAPAAAAGNAALALGVAAVLAAGVQNVAGGALPPLASYSMVNWAGFPAFFGIAIFAYSAHAECLTIAQDLPKATRNAYPSILLNSFLGITALYVLFGGACYYLFGAATPDIIFDAMAKGDWLTNLVKASVSAVLLSQLPITMLPAFDLMEPPLLAKVDSEAQRGAVRVAFRLATVAAMAYVALALPFFFDLMSLVGSFSTGLLGFVLPTLIYLRLKGTELSAAKKALNYGICALGAFGGLYCSWEVLVGMMAR